MAIGRFRIVFARQLLWLQTHGPVAMRRFFFLWIIKGSDPTTADSKQLFPIGSEMVFGGRRYRYCKTGEDIKVGEAVKAHEEGE